MHVNAHLDVDLVAVQQTDVLTLMLEFPAPLWHSSTRHVMEPWFESCPANTETQMPRRYRPKMRRQVIELARHDQCDCIAQQVTAVAGRSPSRRHRHKSHPILGHRGAPSS